jgi:hypothetical protein
MVRHRRRDGTYVLREGLVRNVVSPYLSPEVFFFRESDP